MPTASVLAAQDQVIEPADAEELPRVPPVPTVLKETLEVAELGNADLVAQVSPLSDQTWNRAPGYPGATRPPIN